VAKALEDNRKLLGFSHFSLECDTLERVFLDLCARADGGSSAIRASQDSVVNVELAGKKYSACTPHEIHIFTFLLIKRSIYLIFDYLVFLGNLEKIRRKEEEKKS